MGKPCQRIRRLRPAWATQGDPVCKRIEHSEDTPLMSAFKRQRQRTMSSWTAWAPRRVTEVSFSLQLNVLKAGSIFTQA